MVQRLKNQRLRLKIPDLRNPRLFNLRLRPLKKPAKIKSGKIDAMV